MSDKKIIGKLALKNQFDAYVVMVLGDGYLNQLPRKGKEKAKFELLKPLPTPEEYEKMKRQRFTVRLDDVVSSISGLSDLADELRSWYDNLPESFQQGDKGSVLEESASTLENIQEPDVPRWAGAMAVYAPPMLDLTSRADRRDGIVHELSQALAAIDNALESGKPFPLCRSEDGKTEFKLPTRSEDDDGEILWDELQGLRDELDNIINEAEGVEFPGMYS